MTRICYNKHKFRELIVCLAEKSVDDSNFGDTRLNKQLYFCDFVAYQDIGRAITGAPYRRGQHGPTARALVPVRRELVGEGAIRIEERPRGPVKQRVTIPLRKADLKSFTRQELDVIDEVVAAFKGVTAGHISHVSHVGSPGWNLVSRDENIPYSTALVDIEPPSEQTLTRFRALAAERGW
jgi:hypothetical protein